ncbi:carbohydrate porin, partial [Burkholderia multivorans]|uniref:carbohydrate porin n=1 Tax=Burkholderia multivorans TaxID=87883 RepID=UPI0021BE6FB2
SPATMAAAALSLGLLTVAFPAASQDAGKSPDIESGRIQAASSEPPASPARFDQYGVKGWNFPFPSAADSLLQDAGGFRSALAEHGFGFLNFNVTVGGVNAGGSQRVPDASFVPSLGQSVPYPECSRTSGPVCAGGQTYFGQRPSYYNVSLAYLTYDTSRWGVPDGQIVLGATKVNSSYQDYFPTTDLGLMGLSWYQTLLDKKLELKVGYTTNNQEFVGTYVGGSFANPFGPTASIPVQLGMSIGPTPTPSIRVTAHLSDEIYNSTAIQRSLPINGPTGNPIVDELRGNPSGFKLRVPDAGTLYINELGYKNDAAPGRPQNWLRAGALYNTSKFRDYRHFNSDPTATTKGSWGLYVLGDRQLWQQAPDSPYSAYRGIYAGFSYMYAPPKNVVFTQYLEGRVYWIGPFDSRPTDMLSFVYSRNRMSSYLVNGVNDRTAPLAELGYPVPLASQKSNSFSLSYLAHLRPGLYASVAANYTDKPSFQYFADQGSAWTLQLALTTVF